MADRYIHRRELKLVSLESLSSVEYEIKKIFLIFVFDREISRFNFRESRVNSVDFIHLFSEFLTKTSPILIKFNKTILENIFEFTFKDKIHSRPFSLNFFVTKSV